MSGLFRKIYSLALLVLILFLQVACVNKAPVKTETLYWPKQPNIPRYVHETTIRTSRDVKIGGTAQNFQDMMLGLSEKKNDAFAKPYDVAARSGHILITDSVTRVALMFNVPERKVYPIGQRKGDGELKKPLGVAIDAQKFLYISDVSDQVVKVYDPLGRFIRLIGAKGEFEKPVDVAVSENGDRIYVVDAGGIDSTKHQVIIFDRAGKRLKVIGVRGSTAGNFNLPAQAVVANDGTLYVLDAGNFRVQAFTKDGKLLRSFGKVGRKFGDLARPRGIAADTDGNVYVTDATFRNFQIFNPEGKLLMWIGNGDMFDTPGNLVLPAGIAVDETNRIYVVDQLMRKIEVYRKLRDEEIALLTPQSNAPIKPALQSASTPGVAKKVNTALPAKLNTTGAENVSNVAVQKSIAAPSGDKKSNLTPGAITNVTTSVTSGVSSSAISGVTAPIQTTPTPAAPTPKAPTPKAPTPKAPTPVAPAQTGPASTAATPAAPAPTQ